MTKRKKDIIIANPMYDVVFKTLMMADKDFARYFVETIIGEAIVDIDFAPHEYTYQRKIDTHNQIKEIKVVRLDFVTTIRTKGGEEKKVLIEIQQSYKPLDVLRFRSYLGQQYILRDIKAKDKKDIQDVQALPIIAIYLLGFEMPANPHIAVKIDRAGVNILNGGKVAIKDPLMETLTHDAYFIQVSRITEEMYEKWEEGSELMKLLSLFEQNCFVDGKYFKRYPYIQNLKTNKILEKMVKTLERIAADPYIRRVMEEQEFDELEVNLLNNTIVQQGNTIVQQGNTIVQQGNTIVQQGNTIVKVSAERDNALAELIKLKQKYGLN